MKLIKDKVLVRITAELRESIYEKHIVNDNGEIMKLWKAIRETDQMDERASFLNVQTGIIEDFAEGVTWLQKGDIALINYDICNSQQRISHYDGDDVIFFLEADTTYHQEDEVVWQNQNTKRDQIVHSKGDYDILSGLLGVIREGQLIANAPYIFFRYESTVSTLVSPSGMMYEDQQKIIEREVIAISEESTRKYGIKKGDVVVIDDFDSFPVKINDEWIIDAINDMDVLCL